jgi:hypothetical protein
MEGTGKKLKYILPLLAFDRAYIVNAEVRYVTNPINKNFGCVTIFTDMQYNPLVENSLYSKYMEEDAAIKLLTDLGFISVDLDFDSSNVVMLRSIKDKLPKEWVETFNLWANFTG